MIAKLVFYHFRYLNGLLLRIFTLIILEIIKNNNIYSKFIDDDYNQINEAAENLTKFINPYENSKYRKCPLLPFIFLVNLFSDYNFMKIFLILLDLINSILIELLLNLQQRKYKIEKRIPSNLFVKENLTNKNFFILSKIFCCLNYFKKNKNNNYNLNKTIHGQNDNNYNNNNLSYFSNIKFDKVKLITDKDKLFDFLPLKENRNEAVNRIIKNKSNVINENSIIMTNDENNPKRDGISKKFIQIILEIIDNKYSYFSLYYLYNPIIIISVAKGNYDPLFFTFIFLIMISLELDIYLLAGGLYGISIHFELLPIIFFPGIILYIYYKNQLKEISLENNKKQYNIFNNNFVLRFSNYLLLKIFIIIKVLIKEIFDIIFFVFRTFFSIRPIKFMISTLFWYIIIFTFFYIIFEEYYSNDILLYPIFFKNEKINFSVFNYFSHFLKNAYLKKVFILSIYLIQILLVLLCNLFFHKDLNLCILISTWSYVLFSKEIFLRNISWIFILLCLNIHSINNFNEKKNKYRIIYFLYLCFMIFWGYSFFLIEIFGENKFLLIYIINSGFFLLNCIFIQEICSDKSCITYNVS